MEGLAERIRRRGPIWLLHIGAAGAAVFLVRLLGSGWADGYPIFFPDSFSFAAVAERGPFGGRFWFDERPIGFPLLMWIVGVDNVRAIVVVQSLMYVAAFAALLVVAVRTLTTWPARIVAVVWIAALAVQPRYALWNTHVLSESTSLTAGVAAIAAWWWFGREPTVRRTWLAVTATCWWLLTRDSDVAPFVVVVAPAMLLASWRWRSGPLDVRRALRFGAGLGLVVGAYVSVSQDVSDRNIYPVINNVGQRILPDEGMTAWFEARGMPLDDELRSHTGKTAFDDGFAMLEDPELEEFRDWAEGAGQRWQVISFVVNAPFWVGNLGDDLDRVLDLDMSDYDLFSVTRHLPTSVLGIDGPRSSAQLAGWLAVALIAVVLALRQRRRSLLTTITALALLTSLLDLYLSHAGDSVEVARHLVGPLSRLSLVLVLAIAIGLETLATMQLGRTEPRRREDVQQPEPALEPAPDHEPEPEHEPGLEHRLDPVGDGAPMPGGPAPHAPVLGLIPGLVGTGLLASFVLAGFFGNELRTQDFDPQYMRVLVDRANALGTSYYESGLHNKGPIEPFVYQLASWLTSPDGFWFAIAAFVSVVAAVIGGSVAVTVRHGGHARLVAVSIGIAAFVHFTLSKADYAGVLYSRNIVVALLAAAWTLAIWDRCWQSPRSVTASLVGVAVLLGAAVQTLLPTVFAAMAIALVVVGRLRRDDRTRWVRRTGVAASVGAATVLLAPAWYAATGRFDQFWGGWWTYASYQSRALDRSLPAQFGLAWDQAVAYYRTWWLSGLVILAFVVAAAVRWRRATPAQRVVRLAIGVWLVAAWIELALGQRYSSHYFSVLALPTWLAFATAVADIGKLVDVPLEVRPTARPAIPAVVAAAALVVGGMGDYALGVADAGNFTGVADLAASRRQQEFGNTRTVRSTLDLVSDDGGPLLAWTEYPWTYLQWDRISATRYIWGSFLTGQIYLGASGPEFIPPHTAEWFADDLARTRPVAFVQATSRPVAAGTPTAAVVAADFELVYDGPVDQLWLERDVAIGLLDRTAGAPPLLPEDTAEGWRVGPGTVAHAPGTPSTTDQLLAAGTCVRIDGQLGRLGDQAVRFVVDDLTDQGETQYLTVTGDEAWSSSDNVEFERSTWTAGTGRFSIVVGDRSAVIIVDGMVRAGVRTFGDVEVSVRATGGEIALRVLTSSPAATNGC